MTKQTEMILMIDNILKPNGFKRKKLWYRTNEETVHVIDIQKSQYGSDYFLNIGVCFSCLLPSNVVYLPEHLCHLRIRATSAFPEDALMIDETLDISSYLSNDERLLNLKSIFQDKILCVLDAAKKHSGVKQLFDNGFFKRGLILKIAMELLVSTK